jgi:asparagine synthase (glutamine-hydrolysing)
MTSPEEAKHMLRSGSLPDSGFRWPFPDGGPAPSSQLHGLLLANFESYLPDDLLVKSDRMTMNHGLELRCPFLSKELIDTGFSLPCHGLMNGLQLKYWLKKAYAGTLPPDVLTRRKHGFGVPIHVWLRKGLQEWAAARILDARSPLYDHLEPDAVKLLWRGHQEGQFDAGQRLWGLIVLDHFLRRIQP